MVKPRLKFKCSSFEDAETSSNAEPHPDPRSLGERRAHSGPSALDSPLRGKSAKTYPKSPTELPIQRSEPREGQWLGAGRAL